MCAGAIAPLLDAVEGVIGGLAGRQLADVGCGTGTLAARATGRGASVSGVDPAINGLWADVIKSSGAATPTPELLPPDKDFDRTEQGLGELLTGAGLTRVAAATLTWEFRIDAEDLWAGPAGGVGGIGKIVTSQPLAIQSVMRREYERLISPMVRNGQVVLPAVALLATGQAGAF